MTRAVEMSVKVASFGEWETPREFADLLAESSDVKSQDENPYGDLSIGPWFDRFEYIDGTTIEMGEEVTIVEYPDGSRLNITMTRGEVSVEVV